MMLFLDSWKASHRSHPEQAVGLGIFLSLNAALLLVNFQISLNHWIMALCCLFYLSGAIAAWALWRKASIRTLFFEMSLYLGQFPLQIIWALSFCLWEQTLLALMLGLLQLMATLLAMLAFWKRDRLSGQWMIVPFFLSSCAICINLEICLCC